MLLWAKTFNVFIILDTKIYEIGSRKPLKDTDPQFKLNQSKSFDFSFYYVQCLISCFCYNTSMYTIKAATYKNT